MTSDPAGLISRDETCEQLEAYLCMLLTMSHEPYCKFVIIIIFREKPPNAEPRPGVLKATYSVFQFPEGPEVAPRIRLSVSWPGPARASLTSILTWSQV